MTRLLAIRLVQAAFVLLVMSFLVYGLMGLMPGDPILLMAAGSPKMTAQDVAQLQALYGLDQPLLLRYGHWLRAALSGDLGFSRLSGQPVGMALQAPLHNTVLLMASALLLALLLALPAGVMAALRQGRWLDHLFNLTAFAAISLPVFWMGLLLILLFAVDLAWLPASGVITAGGQAGFLDRLAHLALPVTALALAGFGHYLRYSRAAMIQALSQDWVRTARAKGLSWSRVVTHHALRPAMIPVVTILALDLGTLFSGVLVTETVFAYPGMGKLIYDAVMGNDYNLALAGLLLATLLTLAGSLLADILYHLLDPRISLG
ncbi:MAG TPA: ABC transporter permease [Rhodospirillaceae bacterium]|nr:ABC transporter permease [Rhodospirillaceae bacterium]